MPGPRAEPARRAACRLTGALALSVAVSGAVLLSTNEPTSTAAMFTGQATVAATVTATPVCASGTAAYATALAAFSPAPLFWWRFDTAAGGTTVSDFAPGGLNPGTVRKVGAGASGLTFGTAGSGVINCDTTFGMLTAGSPAKGFVRLNGAARPSPTTLTLTTWVKVPTGATGRLLGFGNSKNGTSGTQDRALTVDATGHVVFSLNKQGSGSLTLTSPTVITDGKAHFLAATLAPGQASLYVDGVLAATSSTTAPAGPLSTPYSGYWRAGYDTPGQCAGDIDEVAVWEGTALTAAQITTLAGANHWW